MKNIFIKIQSFIYKALLLTTVASGALLGFQLNNIIKNKQSSNNISQTTTIQANKNISNKESNDDLYASKSSALSDYDNSNSDEENSYQATENNYKKTVFNYDPLVGYNEDELGILKKHKTWPSLKKAISSSQHWPEKPDTEEILRRDKNSLITYDVNKNVSRLPNNVKRVIKVLPENKWNEMFPLRNKVYTYVGFLTAVHKFPMFCGEKNDQDKITKTKSLDDMCKAELATFFAHSLVEVGAYGPENENVKPYVSKYNIKLAVKNNELNSLAFSPNPNKQGLFFINQGQITDAKIDKNAPNNRQLKPRGYHDTEKYNKCDGIVGKSYPCTWGKGYYGRGAWQIKGNENYGKLSRVMFGPRKAKVLLNNPERVEKEGWLAFGSALFLYMTPKSPNPSMHDTVVRNWLPNQYDLQENIKQGFGVTILMRDAKIGSNYRQCGFQTTLPFGLRLEKAYENYAKDFNIWNGWLNNKAYKNDCNNMRKFNKNSKSYYYPSWGFNPNIREKNCVLLEDERGPWTPLIPGDYDRCLRALSKIHVLDDVNIYENGLAPFTPIAKEKLQILNNYPNNVLEKMKSGNEYQWNGLKNAITSNYHVPGKPNTKDLLKRNQNSYITYDVNKDVKGLPSNVKRVIKIIPENEWNNLFPIRNKVYTYVGFLTAVHKFPMFCGEKNDKDSIIKTKSLDDICRAELATFFTHSLSKVGAYGPKNRLVAPYANKYNIKLAATNSELSILTFSNDIRKQGLFFANHSQVYNARYDENPINNKKLGILNSYDSNIIRNCEGVVGKAYPCAWGKTYYGRGVWQIVGNENYGKLSRVMFGPKNAQVLLNNPERVEKEGWLAFGSGLYLYMKSTTFQPSMHNTVVRNWLPSKFDVQKNIKQGFGVTILINDIYRIPNARLCVSLVKLPYAQQLETNFIKYAKYFGVWDNWLNNNNYRNDCVNTKSFNSFPSTNIKLSWGIKTIGTTTCQLLNNEIGPWSSLIPGDYERCSRAFKKAKTIEDVYNYKHGIETKDEDIKKDNLFKNYGDEEFTKTVHKNKEIWSSFKNGILSSTHLPSKPNTKDLLKRNEHSYITYDVNKDVKELPSNVKRVIKIIPENEWEILFPVRNKVYTYVGFLTAVHKFPQFCGDIDENSQSTNKRSADDLCSAELATLFAHFYANVGTIGEPGTLVSSYANKYNIKIQNVNDLTFTKKRLINGLFFVNQLNIIKAKNDKNPPNNKNLEVVNNSIGTNYRHCNGVIGDAYPCAPGKLYYGRGPWQIKGNEDYGKLSRVMFGPNNEEVLLNNPEWVEKEGWLAFGSALYLYMTPKSPSPSIHNTVVGKWTLNIYDSWQRIKKGFGVTLLIRDQRDVSATKQCGFTKQTTFDKKQGDAYKMYSSYFGIWNNWLGNNDYKNDCVEMKQFSEYSYSTFTPSWGLTTINGKKTCGLLPYEIGPWTSLIPGDYERCLRALNTEPKTGKNIYKYLKGKDKNSLPIPKSGGTSTVIVPKKVVGHLPVVIPQQEVPKKVVVPQQEVPKKVQQVENPQQIPQQVPKQVPQQVVPQPIVVPPQAELPQEIPHQVPQQEAPKKVQQVTLPQDVPHQVPQQEVPKKVVVPKKEVIPQPVIPKKIIPKKVEIPQPVLPPTDSGTTTGGGSSTGGNTDGTNKKLPDAWLTCLYNVYIDSFKEIIANVNAGMKDWEWSQTMIHLARCIMWSNDEGYMIQVNRPPMVSWKSMDWIQDLFRHPNEIKKNYNDFINKWTGLNGPVPSLFTKAAKDYFHI